MNGLYKILFTNKSDIKSFKIFLRSVSLGMLNETWILVVGLIINIVYPEYKLQ